MPIDPEFKKKRKKVATCEKGNHPIWGPPYDPPKALGIHGEKVCVDFDICIADGACIDACPSGVYEWVETPGHPTSDKKADPVHEDQCIACLACESVCPVQAIKVFTEEEG